MLSGYFVKQFFFRIVNVCSAPFYILFRNLCCCFFVVFYKNERLKKIILVIINHRNFNLFEKEKLKTLIFESQLTKNNSI